MSPSEINPFIYLIGVPLLLFLQTLALKFAAKLIIKTNISLGRSLWIWFIAGFLGRLVTFPISLFMKAGGGPVVLSYIVVSVVGLAIMAGIFGLMLKKPESDRAVGYGKGFLVMLVYLLIAAALCALPFALLYFWFSK